MLILENSTKTGLKHRVIGKVQSLNFAQKNSFYKRTKRILLKLLTKKPYNVKNVNCKMPRNTRFQDTIFFGKQEQESLYDRTYFSEKVGVF